MEAQTRVTADSVRQAALAQRGDASSGPDEDADMSGHLRRLLALVEQAPYEFDLFEVLRHIDAYSNSSMSLGTASHPRDEPVRLAQEPSLAFAPSTLAKVRSASGKPPRISIYSFGLFGPNGPLPLHLTEYARERIRNHADRSLVAFADIFHHRLILYFYRAWANAQATVCLDRKREASFDRYVGSLIHVGQPALKDRGEVADHARYYMAGALTRPTRNVDGLRGILSSYFGVGVEIVEFVPGWIPIEPALQLALRAHQPTGMLGAGALLGSAVRDAQHAFQIVVGPLPLDTYRQFLPGTPRVGELVEWVRFYLGLEFAWTVRLVLAHDEVCAARIGQHRLGWESWLGERADERDADDMVFDPSAGPLHATGVGRPVGFRHDAAASDHVRH
jgi:type VI secretion system protein ImpH